jgi:hypothetical protein
MRPLQFPRKLQAVQHGLARYGSVPRQCVILDPEMIPNLTLTSADNSAYLLFASDNNQNFKIARLDSNYYTVQTLMSTQSGITFEAPGIIKRNGLYSLFASHTSGWAANPNKVVTVSEFIGTMLVFAS